jgi:CRISPR-associated endonuclease Csn1
MGDRFPKSETENQYRLGIDLGTNSLGWAIVLDVDGEQPRIVQMGMRSFDAGVSGSLGEIQAGKDQSRATARRDARGPRRQAWRRQRRLRNVFQVLQKLRLLPESDDDSHDTRNRVIGEVDRELRQEYLEIGDHAAHQVLPYQLRANALDEKLPRFALGRALYHLAQRRGFLSNRKARREDESDGVVKAGIHELGVEMERTGSRTLGEYFASLDLEQQKIRGRWTARRMYVDEFEQIWAAQSKHYDDLTEEAHDLLSDVIFHQRELKSQKGLIGACELEPGKRRAPMAIMEFQEFRLLQRVNDLVMIDPWNREYRLVPEGQVEIPAQEPEKRDALVAALQECESLTFAKISKLLGLKADRRDGKSVKWTFNFQEGGEKGLRGNTTAAKLLGVLGDRWRDLSREDQCRLVDEIISFESEEVLVRRLRRAWSLDEATARKVGDLHFEQGYGSFSRKILRAHLDAGMRCGAAYYDAHMRVREKLGILEQKNEPVNSLPANHNCKLLRDVRNPAVVRALSELRLVVNALIRRYGKPKSVHVELLRELKHGRDRRKRMTDRNRRNETLRNSAKAKILEDMEGSESRCTRHNILKVRLADECGWRCPYTNKQINMDDLVGDHPRFEVEHIIPFSRSFDNSYANKTLCYHEENRHKSNRTPFGAYGHTDRWDEILGRVAKFNGERGLVARKLALFKQEEPEDTDDFIKRQFTDTAYMSRLAADYLALLYGGRCDAEGVTRVWVSPGRVTSYLRQRWNLNIFGPPDQKGRDDHRHHAVDALVIALTEKGNVENLSNAAKEAEELGQRGLFVPVDQPWEGFLSDVFTAVEAISVSSRVSRKLNGQLHDATILSPPKPGVDKKGKPIQVHHVRKKLEGLTKGMVDDIVDDRVREKVKERLAELGGDPAKAFQDKNNHPYFRAKDGRVIPIHKVRIRKGDKPIEIGRGSKRRYVNPGANHHLAVVAVLDKKGNDKRWEYRIVTRFEALQRKRRGEQIVLRPKSEQEQFKFSLAGGEHVLMQDGDGVERLYRVTVISQSEVEFVLHTDARPITVRKKEGGRVRCTPKRLKEREARKVTVDPLGNILPAND